MISLVGIFLIQTWMVYADETGRALPPLSPDAQAGRELWRNHNCQSCHQLFGFGGFLGPDLTNIARRLAPLPELVAKLEGEFKGEGSESGGRAADPAPSGSVIRRGQLAGRIETALSTGSFRMPAYHFDAHERSVLAAYLIEIDRMGVGQVTLAKSRPPRELFETLIRDVLPELSEWNRSQREGLTISLDKGCIDCHLPNVQSSFRARDLTRIHAELDPEQISLVLREGLPEKGMPRFDLNASDTAAVRAFLALLAENGPGLRAAFTASTTAVEASIFELPWFEYNR